VLDDVELLGAEAGVEDVVVVGFCGFEVDREEGVEGWEGVERLGAIGGESGE
jgi:hypothetical protein